MSRAAALVLLGVALAAPAAGFERSEARAPCRHADPLRRPWFGDLHVHTAWSFDASALGVRATPDDAYRFARGEPLALRPYDAQGRGAREARLARPLDFAAVTDHAELLGEVDLCRTPGAPGHTSLVCTLTRRWPLLAYYVVNSAILNVAEPRRFSFCGEDGAVCRAAAAGPWQDIQRAAEAAYDRSAACRFTSFVGYEWSGNPDGNMIHRNVIFRGAVVPERPSSVLDEHTPEALWEHLERACLDAGMGCDALAVPHNANVSGGWLFRPETGEGRPADPAWARRRARIERLFEIVQHKGASECRRAGLSPDEACGFELLPFARMDEHPTPWRWSEPPPRSFAREALAEGLRLRRALGANPFALGFVGSTDTHEGAPGLVDERGFPGHAAGGDTAGLEPPVVPDHLFFNPGGLAVLWAEENSRDALFEAMRRREAYATSGPRLVVRLFAGFDLPDDLCARPDFSAQGYAQGVPMGGDLPAPPRAGAAPALAVQALRDPGSEERPGAALERVQLVKIALGPDGAAREQVIDVAGGPAGADVDPATCAPRGFGAPALCAVWRDPAFDARADAVYYARVLENPSCRWTGHLCAAREVDCRGAVPEELSFCCDGATPLTSQERAWTSPVFYAPEPEGP